MQTTSRCNCYGGLDDENRAASILCDTHSSRSRDRSAPKRFFLLAITDGLHNYLSGQRRRVGVFLERGVKHGNVQISTRGHCSQQGDDAEDARVEATAQTDAVFVFLSPLLRLQSREGEARFTIIPGEGNAAQRKDMGNTVRYPPIRVSSTAHLSCWETSCKSVTGIASRQHNVQRYEHARVRAFVARRNTNKVHTWAQTAAGNVGASPAAELPRLGEGGGDSDMARRRQLPSVS